MKLSFKVLFSLLAVAGLSVTSVCQAQQTSATTLSVNNGSISLLGGLGLLNNAGGGGFIYGVSAIASHAITWEYGAQYNSFNPSSTLTLSNIDAVFRWAPGGSIEGLKFGVMAGAGILSSSTPGVSSTTNFNYGVSLLYDVAMSDHFTLGPQFDFLWNTGSNNYTDLNVMAALRYWF